MIEISNSMIFLLFFLQFLNCFQCQLYPYLFQGLEQGNLLGILMAYLIYVPTIILDYIHEHFQQLDHFVYLKVEVKKIFVH